MRAAWSPIPAGEELVAQRFHAAPGWRTWRPHGTADWEILVTVRGSGRFAHPGGVLPAGAARVLLLRPGAPHDHGPAPGVRLWEVAWVHFHARDGWLDLLEWPEPAPGLLAIDLPDDQERLRLLALLDGITALQRQPGRNRRRLAACLLEQLLLRLDECNPRAAGRRDARVAAVVERLLRSARQDGAPGARPAEPGRDGLARAVGLSPSRLSHLFQREMGMSLPAFRERLRLERAALLLDRSADAIAAIAAACGYADPFYFSNRFRRAKGMSPSAWRARPDRHDYTGEEPVFSGWSGLRPDAGPTPPRRREAVRARKPERVRTRGNRR